MARKVNSRVVLNRQRLSRVHGALADGMGAVAQAVIDTARPPDATPFGEGLVTAGGTYVSVNGRKVGGTASRPRNALRDVTGIVALAGYGFPGRFQEFGTVRQPPHPFLTPAWQRVRPTVTLILAGVVRAQLRTIT